MRSCALVASTLLWIVSLLVPATVDPLEAGFRDPPPEARPSVYFLLLDGYLNRDWVVKELEEYRRLGVTGLTLFDMGARGPASARPPAGPQFLSPASVADLAHVIHIAGKLGMKVELSVSSSWDMGASWVTPQDASKTLVHSHLELEGPRDFNGDLPVPPIPAEAPKDAQGRPLFFRDVALIGIRNPELRPGFDFIFELEEPVPRTVARVVLYNAENPATGHRYARRFTVSVSESSRDDEAFRQVLSGFLEPRLGPQEFRFPPTPARYVRLHLLDGEGGEQRKVALAEFEVWTADGYNAVLSYRGRRTSAGAKLLEYSSALNVQGEWAAENVHDGRWSCPAGCWASSPMPAVNVRSLDQIVRLERYLDRGRLRWRVPEGRWLLIRYALANTGERLKVPSPNSDGLATDHLDAEVTRRYIREVIRRLGERIGDFRRSALHELYLASYEVRGMLWSESFLEEFRKRRGYDLAPFLPLFSGARILDRETADRVIFDYRKTLGEVVVDAYYRAAVEEAHKVGLGVQAEAGGPGPPVHQVPVDALKALGAIDSVRGEFWPFRPDSPLWVVKETAAAAHIYNKPVVHMEAFTSNRHWEEAPQDLKASADRAFTEGMNHVVWHTSAHQPPEAGKPGWAYGAGTHLMPSVPWWPMGRAFLDYLARVSFLMQQGRFVADVLYYYGDGGFNFVPPKHVDPSLGFGFDYDVINAEVLARLRVRDGKLYLPHGMEYQILVLPERRDVDPAALEQIAALVRDGATVVGPKPLRASGYDYSGSRDSAVRALADKVWGPCDGVSVREHRYGQGKVVCGRSLRDVLAERGVGPDLKIISPADARLDFIHRRTERADIYFVRNLANEQVSVEVQFRVRKKVPELWDAVTGAIREASEYEFTNEGVRLPLRLESEGSQLVVFRREASQSKRAPPSLADTVPTLEIAGPWILEFPPGWGAPERVSLKRLISWTDHPDPGVRCFSGVATYRTEFEAPQSWVRRAGSPELDLGDLWGAAEVWLNDKPLGVAWTKPFRVPVGAALRAGKNRLVVKVANNWVNRLACDARGEGGPFTRTNIAVTGEIPRPWAKVELRRSGLFGPVRLRAN
jgi:hypothetical protein